MTSLPEFKVTVRKGRTASVQRRHPWVYAGALLHPPKNLPPGSIVQLVDEHGTFLARGGFNDQSQITVRVLSFELNEPIDAAFVTRRIEQACERRAELLADPATTACRLVFAEADRLPGLIVDRYGQWLVMQVLTAGAETLREHVVAALAERLEPRGIYERSDVEDRRKYEGLEPRSGVAWGDEPPATVEILEHGRRFHVDVRGGHKTGFYLDQRENRARVAAYAAGRRVLNAFAYTGGFGIHAAAAGASEVVHIDGSAGALELAQTNVSANPSACRHCFEKAQVFEKLRDLRRAGETFDLIVLDPPKFAASRGQLERASRGYRDLNAQALRMLQPGGLLATFSCTGAVSADVFRGLVADAAGDAGRQVLVREVLGQPADHPVLLNFPEGAYLKGLIVEVVD